MLRTWLYDTATSDYNDYQAASPTTGDSLYATAGASNNGNLPLQPTTGNALYDMVGASNNSNLHDAFFQKQFNQVLYFIHWIIQPKTNQSDGLFILYRTDTHTRARSTRW